MIVNVLCQRRRDINLHGGDIIRWYAISTRIQRISDFSLLIPLVHVGDYSSWNNDILSVVPNWIANVHDAAEAARWIAQASASLKGLYKIYGPYAKTTYPTATPTMETPIKTKPEKIDWLKITAETVDRS